LNLELTGFRIRGSGRQPAKKACHPERSEGSGFLFAPPLSEGPQAET
jgi:hypothetical protein